MKTDVVIVGAGPTGLALACQFVRYGVDFVVIEKNSGVTPYSKAIGVQARTLELYEQLGIAKEAVDQGAIGAKGRFLVGGEIRGEVDFSSIGEGLSPYPFVLMLEQSKNERLLYNYLRNHERDVLWNTELQSFHQNETGVTVQARQSDGTQVIEARYLVACDGAKSPVRHALNLQFEGSTFERMFFVADAQVDWQLSHDALHVCLAKESFVVFFPLKGNQRYRIVGVFPEEFAKEEGEVLYEEIEQRIKQEAKLDLDVHDVEWFSTYKVHTRHVNRFSLGRCFLAGDSAHVHSPAGAQGMNTGIQDSYNLAWKMALVLRGAADEKLLDTYNEERLENAKNLLQTTDRMFQLVASPEWYVSFVRMNVFPQIAKYLLSFDAVKHFIFPIVSQIGINYRHSSLSDHNDDKNFKVKAGDRMPYFMVDDKSVFDLLHEPKFHWLVFSARDDVDELRKTVDDKYSDLVDVQSLQLSQDASDAFGHEDSFAVLLRPDNYIGRITSDTSHIALTSFLNGLAHQHP